MLGHQRYPTDIPQMTWGLEKKICVIFPLPASWNRCGGPIRWLARRGGGPILQGGSETMGFGCTERNSVNF
jgi:hypothetical protein